MAVSTPDLCDEFADKVQIAEPVFQHFGGKKDFFGPVVTVRCFEDNSKVKELLAQPGEGRVLIVDGGGSLKKSLLGDMLAEQGVINGWAGVVINGAVRDVEMLEKLAIGVMALAPIPLKTEKLGAGDVDLPVSFAGLTVTPGDYLYADRSGLVVASEPLNLTV